MSEYVMLCPTCGIDQPVECPPCLDGHGADCDDRACAICGTAVVLDPCPALAHTPAVRHAA